MKRWLAVAGTVVILCATCPTFVVAQESETIQADLTSKSEEPSGEFAAYWAQYTHVLPVYPRRRLAPGAALDAVVQTVHDVEAVRLEKGTTVSWEFEAEASGLYRVGICYMAADQSGKELSVGFLVDGEYPFEEATSVTLQRVYEDNGPIEKDNRGNDIAPLQKEAEVFVNVDLDGSANYATDGYYVYLDSGVHRVTLCGEGAPLYVAALYLGEDPVLSYEAYCQKIPETADVNRLYIQEAEDALYKSSSTLSAVHDGSNPGVSPNDPERLLVNVVGGDNWKERGAWISWEVEVPEDGLYTIGFKYKQDTLRGLDVRRRFTIDDTILFEEMSTIRFAYSTKWAYSVLGNENGDCPVYLTKGPHVFRLEVCGGDIGPALSLLDDTLTQLNEMYRRIIMITGVSPDPYNDHYLHRQLPDMLDTFEKMGVQLREAANYLETQAGTSGSEVSSLYETAELLEEFCRRPNTVPERLDRYVANINTLADLLLRLREGPLRLDYIVLTSGTQERPAVNACFWEAVVYRVMAFLASFTDDYAALGNQYGAAQEPLTVWATNSGRDQAMLLKRYVDNRFTKETGIPVNLSLISSSDVLQQAIVGGRQPDVAMLVAKDLPVNLAMREALVDLTQSPYFDEWQERFSEAAWMPYRYGNGLYALPDSQTYNMLFYRKDILDSLGLTPPDTWEELYTVNASLQENNLSIGISSAEDTLYTLLLQNNVPLYDENLSQVLLDSPEAIDIFTRWTEMFTLYGFPLSYNFFNRFRTGEMPVGIADISLYGQLREVAPEIDGLWEMCPIPGTERDGSIHREQVMNANASILLAGTDKLDAAFQFLDWWSSADVQELFADGIESIMGITGRYYSANLEAQARVNWSDEERAALDTAGQYLSNLPQTPASYYLTRNITNAFRKVVYQNGTPREVIGLYTREINEELARKRREFNLS